MITITNRRGSDDLVIITQSQRGSIDQAQFGLMQFGAFEIGGMNIDVSDNGAIVITNRGSST